MTVVFIGFAVLLLMILVLRMPIAFAMGIVGFFGFAILQGLTFDNLLSFRWTAALTLSSNRVIET
ncbi:C4-dicarboxylate ABC transporter permease, partial [Marinomonas arenicola]